MVQNLTNLSPATLKPARAGAIRRYLKKKIAKAHKQNGQKCVTTATYVPNFVEDAWREVSTISELVTFLSPETDRTNQTGFKVSFFHSKSPSYGPTIVQL